MSSVIDSSALENLISMLGPESGTLLPKLIDDFISDAGKLRSAAEDALKKSKPDVLVRSAHTLKSTSASFGATALSRACRELETAAKAGELEGAPLLLIRIEKELAAAKTELLKIKGSLGCEHRMI
jgi:HPt (histidine-containing phosphotransfer) domain-containing protein